MKKVITIIVIVIIVIILFTNIHKGTEFLQEDLIFFEFFDITDKSPNIVNNFLKLTNKDLIENVKEEATPLIFYLKNKNIQLKDVNLMKIGNREKIIKEKIAPGSRGSFDIILVSNKKLQYKVNFKNKSEKPCNLQFYTSENATKFNNLEDLDDMLEGTILKNKEKSIRIFWEWCYETDKENDIRDTIDSKKIGEYKFDITVQAY